MPDRELQPDARAHAEADDVGTLDLQVIQERRGVVGHPLVRDRAIDVGFPAVPCNSTAITCRYSASGPSSGPMPSIVM